MSDTVLDEKITAYSRSPNDELMHYGVSGMNWYTHKYGNWERHAKYAHGQPNPETAGIKAPRNVTKKDIAKKIDESVKYSGAKTKEEKEAAKAIKKEKRAKRKQALKDKMLGVEGETPRKDLSELSSDEIKDRTNRLKIENDYLTALKNAKNLDDDLIKLTSSTGLLKAMESDVNKNAGTLTKRVASYALLKALESLVGEEDAKYLMGDLARKGGKGGKGKDKDGKKEELSTWDKTQQDLDKKWIEKQSTEDYYRRYPERKPDKDKDKTESKGSGSSGSKKTKTQKTGGGGHNPNFDYYNDIDKYYNDTKYSGPRTKKPRTITSITRRKQPTISRTRTKR